MKRIENQSGLQWAAQVLREGSRNEKENFSLAEAPATGRTLFSLAEAPATGRKPFSLAEARPLAEHPFRWRRPGRWQNPLFDGRVSGPLA